MVRSIILGLSLLAISLLPFMASSISKADRIHTVHTESSPADNYASFDSIKTDLHDYIWPTDAGKRVTSSFAEYRSTHFHGGIDISTNGRKGYKVFAARDGFVYRIRVSPAGYGKMLYVKHEDGYVTTYAHLDRFNDRIRKVARDEQYRKGTFTIDMLPDADRIPVKKGEVIAYTGDTGFGPPHLHFELRDENLNPINPMLCPTYDVSDAIAPTIRRLLISPLSPTSTVANQSSPKILNRFAGTQRSRKVTGAMPVHGLIGFGLEAQDRSDGSWSRSGIHELALYLDDSLIFQMELNRVPSEETKQIHLHYDYPLILDGWGKFQKLYLDTGNILPFYNRRSPGSGIINTEKLSQGSHEYRIVCSDIRGNSSELSGTIVVNHQLEFSIVDVDDDEVVLTGKDMSTIAKCYLYGKRNFAPAWVQHTLPLGRFERDLNGIELPVDTKKYDVLKIVIETSSGAQSLPRFHFNRKPNGPVHRLFIDNEMAGSSVRLMLSSAGYFTQQPVVTVREGMTTHAVEMEAIDLSKHVGYFQPSASFAGERIVEAITEINGKEVRGDDSFDLFSVPPDKRGLYSTGKEGLLVLFDSAAVYRTLPMQISTEIERGTTIYTLEPQDQILNRGVTCSIPFDQARANERLGLYFRGTGGWILQTAEPDKDRAMFSTTLTRTLGELAIMPDNDPPSLGRLRVLPGGGALRVTFRYSDNRSGVDLDELKMYIDDELVIPEIDGERRRVSYTAPERLRKGKHSLRIFIADRLKNATELTRTFTVR